MNLEINFSPCRQSRVDQISYDFCLRIDGDGAPASQVVKVNAMIATLKTQCNSVVNEALTSQPVSHTHVRQQVNGVLLENAGAHPLLYIFASSRFQHDGLNALQVQEVRQYQPRRPCPNNPNLRSHSEIRKDMSYPPSGW